MNKPKAAGTRWESEFVRQAQEAGLLASRFPEGGSRDIGDAWLVDTPGRNVPDIPVVAWSRLVDNGTGRRVPDGARAVIVLSVPHFFEIIRDLDNIAFVVECKSAERLNVTRELENATRKLRAFKERR